MRTSLILPAFQAGDDLVGDRLGLIDWYGHVGRHDPDDFQPHFGHREAGLGERSVLEALVAVVFAPLPVGRGAMVGGFGQGHPATLTNRATYAVRHHILAKCVRLQKPLYLVWFKDRKGAKRK